MQEKQGKDPSKKHFTEEEADDEKEEEEEEDDAGDKEEEEQEPLPWGRLLLMFGLLGGAIFFGSRTVMELFPSCVYWMILRHALDRAPQWTRPPFFSMTCVPWQVHDAAIDPESGVFEA